MLMFSVAPVSLFCLRNIMLLTLSAVALNSCGKDSLISSAQYLGHVQLTQFVEDPRVTTQAAFWPLGSGGIISALPFELDRCVARLSYVAEPTPSNRVGVGPSVRIEGLLGTYAILTDIFVDGGPLYTDVLSGRSGSLPTSALTVQFSSGAFAALSGSAFPTPAPVLEVLAPAVGEQVTASTTFSWRASGSDAVMISATGVVGDPNVNNPRYVSFICYARDDGSFSLPADVRADLARFEFTTSRFYSIGTVRVTRYFADDAALFLTSRTLHTR